MAPIRIRHPKGVATIDIDIENATVLDLQQKILEITEILPSQQERTLLAPIALDTLMSSRNRL